MKARMTAALLAGLVGVTADQAQASYKASVQAGTLRVTGDNASDALTLALRPAAPSILELDVGADGVPDLSFDRTLFSAIDVAAGGGDDVVRVDQRFGAFVDEAITIDGGSGNDVVTGGDGNDTAQLGSGNDRTVWNPGDDNDTIEGESGVDTVVVNGSARPSGSRCGAGGRVRSPRHRDIVTDLDGASAWPPGARRTDMVGVSARRHRPRRGRHRPAGPGRRRRRRGRHRVVIGGEGDDRPTRAATARPHGRRRRRRDRVTGGEAQDALLPRPGGRGRAVAVRTSRPSRARRGRRGCRHGDYEGTAGDDDLQVVPGVGEAVVVSGAAAPFGVLPDAEELAVRGGNGADTMSASATSPRSRPSRWTAGTATTCCAAARRRPPARRQRQRRRRRNQGTDTARLGSGNDQSGGIRATPATASTARAAATRSSPTAGSARPSRSAAGASHGSTCTREHHGRPGRLERMGYRAHGGDDNVTVNDLSATDVDVAFLDIQGIAAGARRRDGRVTAATAPTASGWPASRTRSASPAWPPRRGSSAASRSTTRCGSTRSAATTRSRSPAASTRSPRCSTWGRTTRPSVGRRERVCHRDANAPRQGGQCLEAGGNAIDAGWRRRRDLAG